MSLRFSKMHGIGNDFVIVDCREQPLTLHKVEIARMGDRHVGVGFDQLLAIVPATDPSCRFAYVIFNSDGSPAAQCGNGVRCVAAWLRRAGALGAGNVRLQSPSGVVEVDLLDDGGVRVDMGAPRFAASDIPLAMASGDPLWLQIDDTDIAFGAVSMGNPHAVIEVQDTASAPLESIGARLSVNAAFPEGCNVGFVQLIDRSNVRLRVWERGAGATLACGTGACAAVAVLRRRGKLDADVAVALPGGILQIHCDDIAAPVWMTGAAQFVFEGEWDA